MLTNENGGPKTAASSRNLQSVSVRLATARRYAKAQKAEALHGNRASFRHGLFFDFLDLGVDEVVEKGPWIRPKIHDINRSTAMLANEYRLLAIERGK